MNKKKILFIILFIYSINYAQVRNYDTYSNHKHTYAFEASYGFTGFQNTRDDENLRTIGHFDLGLKWMGGKVWGAKISFANDKTRVIRNEIESGCDYTRFSLESVCNLTNLISDVQNRNRKFNVLAHVGGGYAYQKSTVLEGTDELGSVVFGINPQYALTNRLNLGVDLTGVANFSRHFDYNGLKIQNGSSISETGLLYNASITISYTYWKSSLKDRINKIEETEKIKKTEKSKKIDKPKKTEAEKKIEKIKKKDNSRKSKVKK